MWKGTKGLRTLYHEELEVRVLLSSWKKNTQIIPLQRTSSALHCFSPDALEEWGLVSNQREPGIQNYFFAFCVQTTQDILSVDKVELGCPLMSFPLATKVTDTGMTKLDSSVERVPSNDSTLKDNNRCFDLS